MHTGMLYFDHRTKKSFHYKVACASFYFKRKYRRMPEIVIVNPVDIARLPIQPPDKLPVLRSTLTVRSWERMLPGCIGVCLDGDLHPKVESPGSVFIRHAQQKENAAA